MDPYFHTPRIIIIIDHLGSLVRVEFNQGRQSLSSIFGAKIKGEGGGFDSRIHERYFQFSRNHERQKNARCHLFFSDFVNSRTKNNESEGIHEFTSDIFSFHEFTNDKKANSHVPERRSQSEKTSILRSWIARNL